MNKDSATGKQESTAGYLDLTTIQEYGDDGSTAYPATTLGYSTQDESYIDSTFYPYSTGYCGFAWNSGAGSNGPGTGCSLWSVSHADNDRYLTTVDNGEGLHTTFTWQNARNNTHGLPTGIPATRPFSCTTASSSTQAAYPCDAADDQAWSRIVLPQRDDTVVQLSHAGTRDGIAMKPLSAYGSLARQTNESISRISDGSTLYSLSRTFDNVGNVASVNTTLPAGTDNQVFCYNEQNRLIWAGSTGTPSCGTSLTAGTLTSAAYSQHS